jgi:predicted phosphodiesterase
MKIHLRLKTERKPHIRFGVVSDTHLASDYEALDNLNELYDLFEKSGITTVLHSGDITDGFGVYTGQENYLKVTGVGKQAKYTVDHYPRRKGIQTILIGGNHDLKAFKQSGIDVCSLITHGGFVEDNVEQTEIIGREDITYLGRYYARINWNGITIDMVHPDYGFAYAVSYPVQKYVNELEGGTKPDILIFGHLHRMFFMDYRNINCVMAGCFQHQNDFLKRKGISPTRGGWILEMDKSRKSRTFTPQAFKWF